mmetsp:Transcript_7847/g.7402  ORF Transcript_7847/g.7402 Transcript_7847/m.7402 type:complete len:91 (-) Transcript_7847:236-508(-)
MPNTRSSIAGDGRVSCPKKGSGRFSFLGRFSMPVTKKEQTKVTEAAVETPRRKAGAMATLKKISDKQKKKQKGQRPVRPMARAGGNGGPC